MVPGSNILALQSWTVNLGRHCIRALLCARTALFLPFIRWGGRYKLITQAAHAMIRRGRSRSARYTACPTTAMLRAPCHPPPVAVGLKGELENRPEVYFSLPEIVHVAVDRCPSRSKLRRAALSCHARAFPSFVCLPVECRPWHSRICICNGDAPT
jgi:hypothetical protein